MPRSSALSEESFTAATPDNTIFVRVALAGHTLGVQIEPAAMKRPAIEIAQGIMACNDVAYLRVNGTLPEDARRAFRYMQLMERMKNGESMMLMPYDIRVR